MRRVENLLFGEVWPDARCSLELYGRRVSRILPAHLFGVCSEKAGATNAEENAVSVRCQNAAVPIETTSSPLSESDRGLFGFRLAWARYARK